MKTGSPDFEISIDGHALITVQNGQIDVRGQDMPADLSNMMRVIDVISDVVKTAMAAQQGVARVSAATARQKVEGMRMAVASRVDNVCYLAAGRTAN